MEKGSGTLGAPRARKLGDGVVALRAIRFGAANPASSDLAEGARAPVVSGGSGASPGAYNAVVAMTATRSWICRPTADGAPVLEPIAMSPFMLAAPFEAPGLPPSIATVNGDVIRIVTLVPSPGAFSARETPMRYTPRGQATLMGHGSPPPQQQQQQQQERPMVPLLVSIEADPATVPSPNVAAAFGGLCADGMAAGQTSCAPMPCYSIEDEGSDDEDEDEDEAGGAAAAAGSKLPHERQFGAVPARDGSWAACLRLYDPRANATLDLHEVDGDRALMCLATCTFGDAHRPPGTSPGPYIIVGGGVGLRMKPSLTCARGFVRVYRLLPSETVGSRLELVHETALEADAPCLGACAFDGRLLLSIGTTLRLVDLGRSALLRKSELRGLPSPVRTLLPSTSAASGFGGSSSSGGGGGGGSPSLFAVTLGASVLGIGYDPSTNALHLGADDPDTRRPTTACRLDDRTVCVADRFGNVAVLRLPAAADLTPPVIASRTAADGNPSSGSTGGSNGTGLSSTEWWERGKLNGAREKWECVAVWHLGDTVTSMRVSRIGAGGVECVVYATISGAVGAFVPFRTREGAKFFSSVEAAMRKWAPSYMGRDHVAYRGLYFPVRGVVDGELCEQFSTLSVQARNAVALEVGFQSAEDVDMAIEAFRESVL
jgi:splicing factor 3B subunit 3